MYGKDPTTKNYPECKYLLVVCVIIRFFSDYEDEIIYMNKLNLIFLVDTNLNKL